MEWEKSSTRLDTRYADAIIASEGSIMFAFIFVATFIGVIYGLGSAMSETRKAERQHEEWMRRWCGENWDKPPCEWQ